MQFNVGDMVTWSSQSSGSTTTKVGKVVRVLKKHVRPSQIAQREFPLHKRMFDGWRIPGGKDTKEAYLVEVPHEGTSAPRLYLPYPNKLELVEVADVDAK